VGLIRRLRSNTDANTDNAYARVGGVARVLRMTLFPLS